MCAVMLFIRRRGNVKFYNIRGANGTCIRECERRECHNKTELLLSVNMEKGVRRTRLICLNDFKGSRFGRNMEINVLLLLIVLLTSTTSLSLTYNKTVLHDSML